MRIGHDGMNTQGCVPPNYKTKKIVVTAAANVNEIMPDSVRWTKRGGSGVEGVTL